MYGFYLSRFRVGAIQQALVFFVNLARSLLAAVTLETAIDSRQKHRRLPLHALCETNSFAHAVDTNHLPRNGCSALQIIFGSGGDLVKNNFLGRAPAHDASDAIDQFG